jgi:hypothetical protein
MPDTGTMPHRELRKTPEARQTIAQGAWNHRPRSFRIQALIAFLPLPIPGLPMPRYCSKGLTARTTEMRSSSPSYSNRK